MLLVPGTLRAGLGVRLILAASALPHHIVGARRVVGQLVRQRRVLVVGGGHAMARLAMLRLVRFGAMRRNLVQSCSC